MRPVVLHTIHSLRQENGGPSRTVPGLCEAVANAGRFRVMLLTTTRAGETNLLPDPDLVTSMELDRGGPRWTGGLYRRFEATILRLCRENDVRVIHDHGQWLPTNRAAASAARKERLPRVVSTRGMLSPWAMRHRWALKQLAWTAYGRRDLASAAVVHATAVLEEQELRALGVTQPIAVIPNGLELPSIEAEARKAVNPREALFLSRLHPKKGLPELIEAWRRIRPVGWRLLVAGPDENAHRAVAERLVRQAGLDEDIEFVGPVDDGPKWNLYRRASLFILPSYGENFGVVIAEAMAAETPVVTTTATPWPMLQERNLGWWITPGIDSLQVALIDAFGRSDEELADRGRRSREFVAESFGWAQLGERMTDLYERLISGRRVDETALDRRSGAGTTGQP